MTNTGSPTTTMQSLVNGLIKAKILARNIGVTITYMPDGSGYAEDRPGNVVWMFDGLDSLIEWLTSQQQ